MTGSAYLDCAFLVILGLGGIVWLGLLLFLQRKFSREIDALDWAYLSQHGEERLFINRRRRREGRRPL